MKFLLVCILWVILLALAWPLAFLLLLLLPVLWLLSIPFRLVWYLVEGLLGFIKALLLLPARFLRGRNGEAAS